VEPFKILLLTLIVAVPVLCSGFASGAGETAAQVITKEDNGREIAVPEGAIIEVRLEQPGATGFSWQIVSPDETFLKVLESTETPLKPPPIVGSPVLKVWKIRTVKSGQAVLRILLYRPWEGPGKAAESFEVKFQIG